MKKNFNKNNQILDKYSLPLDKIGSFIGLFNIPFESDVAYPIEYENGKYLYMTFNQYMPYRGQVELTPYDISLINVIRSIKKHRSKDGEPVEIVLDDIINVIYKTKKQEYYKIAKERLEYLSTTKVYIDYTEVYNDITKNEKYKLDEKGISNYLINLTSKTTKKKGIETVVYTIYDTPLQFYTDATMRETSINPEYVFNGRITNKELSVKMYIMTKLCSRNINELTIEKIINDVGVIKDKNKRYLEMIDKIVNELKVIGKLKNLHYRNVRNEKVDDIKDAYKLSIKKL